MGREGGSPGRAGQNRNEKELKFWFVKALDHNNI